MISLAGINAIRQTVAPEEVHVLVIIGQSNALGRNQDAGWVDFPDGYKVFIPRAFINYAYDDLPNNTGFQSLDGAVDSVSKRFRYVGAQYGVAKQYTEYKNKAMYVVHYAIGTTSLQDDWNPANQNLYTNAVTYITNAINTITSTGKIPKIVSIYWNQGEQDANIGIVAGQYKTLLTSFFNSLRNESALLPYYVGGNHVNIQLAQLGTWSTTLNQSYAANRLLVRADQIAYAGEAVGIQLVETEDLPSIVGDEIHRTTPAQFTIADRIFNNIKNIV